MLAIKTKRFGRTEPSPDKSSPQAREAPREPPESPPPAPMDIADILAPERVALDLDVGSSKRVLESLGGLLAGAHPALSAGAVFQELHKREHELGSTALGHGVALPHVRMGSCDRTIAAFARLAEGVDFAAPDGAPVDLYFALVVPAECNELHLQVLAAAARALNEESVRARLRETGSAEEVVELLASGTATG